MVFYLKYRPRKISELDSNELVEKLTGILTGKLPDKIPHAFLFTGPKGLGKTSTARILAKAINCTNRKTDEIEPCNKCDSCKSINSGSNLDVLEIDGASNRGIDEIRDLREKIRLSPVVSLKKIYIIDEVHMLTTEAFNALLKTLEEPPEHAFFILCTTEVQKVPETILSRCTNIKFAKATLKDFISSFGRIAKGEDLKIDKEALEQIARLSDGSFRDGAKILEELSSSSKNITLDLIEKKYKTQSIDKSVIDLIESFENKDSKKGIKIVSDLAIDAADFKIIVESLIDKLHKSLISQVNGQMSEMGLDKTKKLIEMLVKTHTSIKYAVLPQLPLELTIIEWAADEESGSRNPPFAKASEGKQELRSDKKSEILKQVQDDIGKVQDDNKKPLPKSTESDNILESLITETKKENFSIAGVLRGCKVLRSSKEELVLSTGFKFHKERLSEAKIIGLLEANLEKITEKKIKFSVELK